MSWELVAQAPDGYNVRVFRTLCGLIIVAVHPEQPALWLDTGCGNWLPLSGYEEHVRLH